MASPAEIQTFKVARETARRMMAAGEVSKEDQDDFLVWLREHMGAYVQSCYSQDWRWSKDSGRWRGKCKRCELSTRATTAEGRRLDTRAGANRG